MQYYIIVFKNTHDAMEADRKLEKTQIEYRIMPTPTSITQSCGICIRITKAEDIETIINESIIEYKNIYEKNTEGFRAYSVK